MIPHHCTVRHDPPNSYGDCLRASIATLMDIEDASTVPHFLYDGDESASDDRMKEWLLERGYRPMFNAYRSDTPADIFAMMLGVNRGINYLLFCQCGGDDHVLVCRDDKIVHDVAWYKSPISGPHSSGYFVTVVLVPVKF